MVDTNTAELLSPKEAATVSGYSESTLAKLRCTGGGPRYLKPSARKVLYRRGDITEWLAGFERASTAENPGRGA